MNTTSPTSLESNSAPKAFKRINAPVYALPLDIFRAAVGLLSFAYFARSFTETADFSAPDGLIDHELSERFFWFTRINLFGPGMTRFDFELIFAFACLCALGLTFGYRPKVCAAILYVIAVCSYRWNFVVIYVDDAIMHLMLFWMLLLPIGRTLTVRGRQRTWHDLQSRWKAELVPGGTMRCFAANFALIYIVAGFWKWTSPMWRNGTAVYAIMHMPIAYAPDFWRPEYLPLLQILNYAAIICEPLFPLMAVLSIGHKAKYLLLALFITFHGFILLTLKLPFANLACLAAGVLLFRDELMKYVLHASPAPKPIQRPAWSASAVSAAVFVGFLSLAMLTSVTLPDWRRPFGQQEGVENSDGLGPVQRLIFASLWSIGIAQQYQLMNWVDQRGYRYEYQIFQTADDGSRRLIEPGRVFPGSIHNVLLQSYLHGQVWTNIPPDHRVEFRRSVSTRYAARFCRLMQPAGTISVNSTIERLVPGADKTESLQMKFSCEADTPRIHSIHFGFAE